MKKQRFCTSTILTLTITLIIINTMFFSTPVAGSDELKREILEDLLALDTVARPELFDEYDELYLAKTKTQALIQGMEGREVTVITKEWVDILLGIIDDFEKAVDLSKSSVPPDHVEAIEIADRIDTSVALLDQYEITKENGIPMLVELALERFYRGEGEFFENVSRNEKETRMKNCGMLP